jgi:hypothetical protein
MARHERYRSHRRLTKPASSAEPSAAPCGSRNLIEFHGNWRDLVCTSCGRRFPAGPEILRHLPPLAAVHTPLGAAEARTAIETELYA